MNTAEVYMRAGESYPIHIEFAEIEGFAEINFEWRIIEQERAKPDLPLQRAMDVVGKSDAVIIVLGENSEEVGEGRDKADLQLYSDQIRLVNKFIYKALK